MSLEQASRSAFHRIGLNLADVVMECGTQDFPVDQGVRFRNELYAYPYAYFGEVTHLLTKDGPKDPWVERNADMVAKLRDDHWIRIIASSHYYVCARDMHFAHIDASNRHMRLTLDWLCGMYRIPTEVPMQWFQLLTTLRDHEAYWKEAQRFFYQDIAYALLTEKNDEEASGEWGGLAFMARLQAQSLSGRQDWQRLCSDQFPFLTKEVARIRAAR
jgi:hypothetical protein